MPPSIPNPTRRSRLAGLALASYFIVLAAAVASGLGWLDALATLMLASLLLWPGLRSRSAVACVLWLLAAAAVAALAFARRGAIALDFTPVMVNAALCSLFARTLARDREPLIARVIAVLESPARLALPRVEAYARTLTLAWALLLGAQAVVLTLVIVCRVPDGLLAAFGIAPPIALRSDAWTAYLHLGSYAGVIALLVCEYAFRRWYLPHIDHVSLSVFMTRLVRRWPALAQSVMNDAAHRGAS